MSRRSRGFSLIELLIVVGIIGILAGIVIYNYFNAVQRARQKKTMADMRTIGQAWEARQSDMQGYNAAGFAFPAVAVSGLDLDALLIPTYARTVPKMDGWGRAFQFALDSAPGSGTPAQDYALRSAGRDGQFETSYTPGPFNGFDCDIVFSNGSFVTYPQVQ